MHILQQIQTYIADKSLLPWIVLGGQALIALLVIAILIRTSRKRPVASEEKIEKYIPAEDTGSKIIELNQQVNSLGEELKKSKQDYAAAQSELQKLRAELSKFKDLSAADKKDSERAQNELSQLKNRLAEKENELTSINKAKPDLETQLQKSKQSEGAKDADLERLRTVSQGPSLEEFSAAKSAFEKENKELRGKVADFNDLVATLNKEIEAQNKFLQEHKNREKATPKAAHKPVVVEEPTNIEREKKRKRIGEVLLEQKFITQEILDKALACQKNTGCNLTQYLLSGGYINEQQLAQCLCMQFGVPYLPLSSYEIAKNIIVLVPVEIAQKYWLVPLEKLGNLLTVVMVDPFDSAAIKEVENHSGCIVQAFVGILSEIMEALTKYYKLNIEEKTLAGKKGLPFFVDVQTYQGPDRRRFVRFNSKIDVQFGVNETYLKSKTMDVSQDGLQFECERTLEIGSYFALQVNLPEDYSPLPIALVAQVVRVTLMNDKKFAIGIKVIKISRPELQAIIRYASTHQEKEVNAGA